MASRVISTVPAAGPIAAVDGPVVASRVADVLVASKVVDAPVVVDSRVVVPVAVVSRAVVVPMVAAVVLVAVDTTAAVVARIA